ncbi:MAG: hypothetical protein M3Y21_12030, partial [Candidatus Eremiobacteraeota bacterium]|nr:hypothetical protein [Candidatus Eremiobacteraeota bacterium]
LQLYAHLERTYAAKSLAYNAWARGFADTNAELKAAGAKLIPAPATVPTAAPKKLPPVVTH